MVRLEIVVIVSLCVLVAGCRSESHAQPTTFPDLAGYTAVEAADYTIALPNPGMAPLNQVFLHRYAFFSNPDGSHVDGFNQFATNGTAWDLTDPAHPVNLGNLPGIFQASGVYDPASNRMYVVGNGSNRIGDTARGLWASAPIDPAHPNDWIKSLQRVGDVGLPGDRESQLIARSRAAASCRPEPRTIQLRVSSWPPGPVYDPHTSTTTFGVQH